MNTSRLKDLLESIKNGTVSVDDAVNRLKHLPFDDLGYAKIDHHRGIRNGYPEVIFCQGKTTEQIKGIINNMIARGNTNIMATRATPEVYEEVRKEIPGAVYHEMARIIVTNRTRSEESGRSIMIVTGGTADIPVAEEAAVTAQVFGNKVSRLYDVGVAGIHRLLFHVEDLQSANVIVAVAGMEGALASVVAGLVDVPVIAVPTSVGYGANFGGLSALLTMINSCANGIAVVNIDNGFGAGYMASMINKLSEKDKPKD